MTDREDEETTYDNDDVENEEENDEEDNEDMEEEEDQDNESNTNFDAAQTLKKFKDQFLPVTVDKPDDLYYDVANLYCFDRHPQKIEGKLDKALAETARDNAQLLFNRIFELQTRRIDPHTVVALLPPSCLPLPREKPVPKEKEPTKWEKFAKIKGITKKKKSRLVYDEEKKEYLPRWGYKRANNDNDEWVIEDKPSERGDYEDPFLKRKADKRERIANNLKRQQANQKAATKTSSNPLTPFLSGGLGSTSLESITGDDKRKKDKLEIQESLSKTRASTASMGKFDPLLPHEKKPKRSKPQQKQPVTRSDFKEEREKNIKLLERVLNKKPEPVEKKKKIKKSPRPQQKKGNNNRKK